MGVPTRQGAETAVEASLKEVREVVAEIPSGTKYHVTMGREGGNTAGHCSWTVEWEGKAEGSAMKRVMPAVPE